MVLIRELKSKAARVSLARSSGSTDALPKFDGGKHGAILFRDEKHWTWLGPGTNGQVLQSQGAAKDAQWVTPSPSGASYVVIALDSDLTSERKLTQGTGITVTDGGTNGNVTIAVNLTQGTGISINGASIAVNQSTGFEWSGIHKSVGINPTVDNSKDLGDPLYAWRYLYVRKLSGNGNFIFLQNGLDFTDITAGYPIMKIRETTDTVTSDPETNAQTGWMEIEVEGAGSSRYIPFYTA